MKTLFEGIVIGVSAGLILSSFNVLHQRYLEHEQVKYVNEILSDSYIKLCNMDGKTRPLHFRGMVDSLKLIVRSRSQNIRYDKLYELTLELTSATAYSEMYEHGYNLTMHDVDFMLFERIREEPRFSWLNLLAKC